MAIGSFEDLEGAPAKQYPSPKHAERKITTPQLFATPPKQLGSGGSVGMMSPYTPLSSPSLLVPTTTRSEVSVYTRTDTPTSSVVRVPKSELNLRLEVIESALVQIGRAQENNLPSPLSSRVSTLLRDISSWRSQNRGRTIYLLTTLVLTLLVIGTLKDAPKLVIPSVLLSVLSKTTSTTTKIALAATLIVSLSPQAS